MGRLSFGMLDIYPYATIFLQFGSYRVFLDRALGGGRLLFELFQYLQLFGREIDLQRLGRANPDTSPAPGTLLKVDNRFALGIHFDCTDAALCLAPGTAGNALPSDEASDT